MTWIPSSSTIAGLIFAIYPSLIKTLVFVGMTWSSVSWMRTVPFFSRMLDTDMVDIVGRLWSRGDDVLAVAVSGDTRTP